MKKTLFTLVILVSLVNLSFAECIFDKPVEIKELTIGNLVTWSTASELENNKFYVEKSLDGITFEAIGELDGAGVSNEVQDYRFLDLKKGEANAYYRLKMESKNESSSSYTHTIFFQRETSNNFAFHSMASPMTDAHFTVMLDSKVAGNIRYRVINQKGVVCLSQSRQIEAGNHLLSVNLQDLPIGTYKMQTTLNDEVEVINLRRVKTENMPKIQYAIK